MSQEANKELAELYLKLYLGCIKYKEINKKKKIKCDNYYNSYINYSFKINDDNKFE